MWWPKARSTFNVQRPMDRVWLFTCWSRLWIVSLPSNIRCSDRQPVSLSATPTTLAHTMNLRTRSICHPLALPASATSSQGCGCFQRSQDRKVRGGVYVKKQWCQVQRRCLITQLLRAGLYGYVYSGTPSSLLSGDKCRKVRSMSCATGVLYGLPRVCHLPAAKEMTDLAYTASSAYMG